MSAPPAVAAPVELVRLPDPNPGAVFADLRARGIAALLCEGGPRLNRALLEAEVVDELFLTLAPLLTGDEDEPGIVAGGRSERAGPARAALGAPRWGRAFPALRRRLSSQSMTLRSSACAATIRRYPSHTIA